MATVVLGHPFNETHLAVIRLGCLLTAHLINYCCSLSLCPMQCLPFIQWVDFTSLPAQQETGSRVRERWEGLRGVDG